MNYNDNTKKDVLEQNQPHYKMRRELYSKTKQTYVADTGMFDNYSYVIRSIGGNYPCAYVGQKDLFSKYDADVLEDLIKVHGGLTFKSCDWYLDDLGSSLDWIGWDYAHMGDYCVWMDADDGFDASTTHHKYTYDEILEDIKSVIEQLKNLKKHKKKMED